MSVVAMRFVVRGGGDFWLQENNQILIDSRSRQIVYAIDKIKMPVLAMRFVVRGDAFWVQENNQMLIDSSSKQIIYAIDKISEKQH